ncbi:kelch repeat-containing protein [Microbulbifer sp. THAF38]|uniref:Kelch repeat-containing protein n=1 Tax=Microbulbifer sp. THAF38 TaxID=2587856 RepID=UPI0012684088|nr:kelch repeat-containing protein [Microbulbifer sp. THAF38]QFT56705.1 N-acetylneuraminate epimerase [Microbulbifer sp. THAF38]
MKTYKKICYSRRSFLKLTGLSPLLLGGTGSRAETQRNKQNIIFTDLPSLEIPIQEIYPSVFAGEIYISGGFIPSSTPTFYGLAPTDSTHIFSPKTHTWRSGPALPKATHHLGMAANSKYLYGIGGFHGQKSNAWQAKSTVYKLSKNDNAWTSAPSLPIPIAEGIYSNSSKGIHVIGGKTPNSHQRNIDSNNHYILTNNTDWEAAAPATINRNSASGTTMGNRIYVIGGRQAGNTTKRARNLTYGEVYDPSLNKWEKIRPLPQALAGLSAAPLNGKIIVTGGEAFGPNGYWKTGTAFNAVWVYNPISDQWNKESDLPTARHGHGAVTIEDTIYIMGGAAKVGPQETLASFIKLNWKP